MIKQFKLEYVKKNRKEVECVILAKYCHLYNMRFNPVFAELLGNKGTISETTKNTNGTVIIRWTELLNTDKFKIRYGSNKLGNYDILKIVQKTPFLITCKVSEYRNHSKVENNLIKTA